MQNFDVVVAGGGPSGFGAAVGAARMGLKVALIERHPVLGGMGTAALVNNFCNAHWDGQRMIIGGVFGDLRQRLIRRKAIYANKAIEPYDPVAFSDVTRLMCEEAGVTLLMRRKITAAVFSAKTSTLSLDDGSDVSARTVVDATGDAHVSHLAGVTYNFGRAEDHAVMPLTYCYMLKGIDIETMRKGLPQAVWHDDHLNEDYAFVSAQAPVNECVRQARERGELSIPRDHVSAVLGVPGRPGYATVNYGRVFVKDPTDPQQLAAGEEQGRQQVHDGIRFFRKYIPGMQNVELQEMARQIGVRESRQVEGLHTLTAEEILAHTQFDDVIAQCRYCIDIHLPNSDKTEMKHIPDGKHYDIPWRCLIPKSGPQNLVIGGRCISATHEAMSSFRVSPSVMAIGEAAGVTAALAVQKDVAVRDVPVANVQARLRETGGVLE